jgi:hypothetical protein
MNVVNEIDPRKCALIDEDDVLPGEQHRVHLENLAAGAADPKS